MISDHDKQHIDELVHNAERNADAGPLDENLSPEAAADAAELIRTRKLLADVSTDAPTPEETETMWQAIAATVGPDFVIDAPPAPSRRRVILQFAAATLAAAATLLIAFSIGQVEYKGYSWLPVSHFGLARRHVERTPAASVAVPEVQAGENEVAGRPIRGFAEAGDGNFWYDDFGVVEASEAGDGKLVLGDEVRERVAGLGYTAEGTVRGGMPCFDTSAGERYKDVEVRGTLSFRHGDTDGDDIGDVNADGLYSLGYVGGAAGSDLVAKGMHPILGTTDFANDAVAGHASVKFTLSQEALSVADSPALNDSFAGVQVRDVEAVKDQVPAVVDGVVAGQAAIKLSVPADPAVKGYDLGLTGAQGQSKEGVAVAGGQPQDEKQKYVAGVTYVKDFAEIQPATEEPQQPPPPAPVPVDRKIIKNGELTIEVAEYDPAADQVETIVRQHGAFVADREIQEKTGGAIQGILTIRVEPATFEALFAALKAVGRLESENVKAADVTAQYVDLEARITAAQLTEDNLKALLAQKSILDKITSMLEIERELARVRTEIEQMQGQLRVMAAQVSLSTIRLTLREPERIVPGAGISVEVTDLDSARESLGEALTSLNGRLLSAKANKREDGTLMGQFELQVTLANFDAFMTAIDGLGRVESRQIKDQQFGDALAPWATRVRCGVNLVLYERSRQLPSGSITLEVSELPAAVQALDPLLEAAKAAITNNQTTRRDDGSAQAQISIRVPAGRFAGLVEALAPLGRLTGKAVAGEAGQITGGAANVLCDLTLTLAEPVRQVPSGRMAIEVKSYDTSRPALEKIIKDNAVQVLASASRQRTDGTSVGEFRLGIAVGHMESVVEKIAGLGRIEQRQIVGLGLGSLSKVDPKALGVIDIALFEKPTVAPPTEQAGGRIRDRLRDGLSGLYASLGLILYGLVVMAPWLVLVVLAAWLFTRWLRKRRPRPAAAPAAKPSAKPAGQK
ncbi:MAG: DUF4349 domain-containing protein [Phycisphaerae bacterium]|nr:DUF4349 domain-containing protein [Phycisphaerae bacterium]